MSADKLDLWIAKQEIAELRRRYAIATDLIATREPASIEAGRTIYHQIFTPNAQLAAQGVETQTGPEAWLELVLRSLKPYAFTQHLIGTQVVDVHSLPGQNVAGLALMTSYLNAWHESADHELWTFLGTYEDVVTHTADAGWQIDQMQLVKLSDEVRNVSPRTG
ncbi:MAG: nuclear transport factor 2 family protein [Proteobacteria bacterium]|nr:nuclear transport factor 2 family protein [Pseudomonadota bacterium]